jgi:hypothetical protein
MVSIADLIVGIKAIIDRISKTIVKAPLPARRAYRPEGRAYSSERGVEFTFRRSME